MITQAQYFATKIIPLVFHTAPQQFLFFLERDGNKLLRFYWDVAAKDLKLGEPENSFGLDYQIINDSPITTIALINIPAPKVPQDPYFIALIYRPNRKLLLVSDTTKVIMLISGEAPGLDICRAFEVSRRGLNFPMDISCKPNRTDFLAEVRRQLEMG